MASRCWNLCPRHVMSCLRISVRRLRLSVLVALEIVADCATKS